MSARRQGELEDKLERQIQSYTVRGGGREREGGRGGEREKGEEERERGRERRERERVFVFLISPQIECESWEAERNEMKGLRLLCSRNSCRVCTLNWRSYPTPRDTVLRWSP